VWGNFFKSSPTKKKNMQSIRILSLYSGSTGNSFLIGTPEGYLLIDAGKSAKRLCAALEDVGVAPEEVRAVLLTHEHRDHISALDVYLKHHPIPVHTLAGSVPKLETSETVKTCLCVHPPRYSEEIGGVRVTAFSTPHDSLASTGYRIEIPYGDGGVFRLGYATDMGYVSDEVEQGLTGCDAVILESNHDEYMLMNGPYPYYLKQRIASRRGHLSNHDSAALAARLCMKGTRALMLAHLSQENNTPEIAYDECVSAVGDARVHVFVAHPHRVTEMHLEG